MFEPVQAGKRTGTIDVWWLYDDGGLTLLLPYILTTRHGYIYFFLKILSPLIYNKKYFFIKKFKQEAVQVVQAARVHPGEPP